MRKKVIEKIDWLAPAVARSCSIAATVLPASGKARETLVIDIAHDKPAVRFCITRKEFASYIPEGSRFAKETATGPYWSRQRLVTHSWNDKGIEYRYARKYDRLNEVYDKDAATCIKEFVTRNFEDVKRYYHESSMEFVVNAISEILWERYERKIKRQQAHLERAAQLIKEPPKAFRTWAEHRFKAGEYKSLLTVAPFYGRNTTTGICSHCGKEHTFGKSILHEKEHKCPSCGRIGTVYRYNYKAENNRYAPKVLASEEKHIAFLQPYDGGVVERSFYARKLTYIDHEYVELSECKRAFEKDGKTCVHIFIRYSYAPGWVYVETSSGNVWSFATKENFFMRSVKDIMRKPGYKYSALDIAMASTWTTMTGPITFLYHYKKMPDIVESLTKIGLVKLAYGIEKKHVKADKGKLWQRLGITKREFAMLKSGENTVNMLEWMQRFHEAGETFGEADYACLNGNSFTPNALDRFRCGSTFHKIFMYLGKQVKPWLSAKDVIQTWSDYLDMAERFKMDLSNPYIYYPKDLKTAHDRIAKELAIIRNKESMEERETDVLQKHPHVNEILSGLSEKYEYKNDTYCIVCPTRINDIIVEGLALSHCLHSDDKYFARIERRESYIVFLRRTSAPDVPYYTLEIEPNGSTRQKRTTGDNQNEDYQDAVSFIMEWQKAIRPRLTAKDRELSRISAILREQEFKEMRDANARIRHGKYAGQPLADVLEADFLDADLFADVAFVEPEVMPDFELPAATAG